jgi:Ca-activated chloride channel family protein
VAEAPAVRRDVARLVLLDLSAPPPEARLAAWRQKLIDLLHASPAGETALVAHAGEPYLIAPLTTDVATLIHFIPALRGDILPVPGRHPERALGMAARLLTRDRSRDRELLWLTPARDAPPAEVAEALAGLPPARLIVWHDEPRAAPAWHALARARGGEVVAMRADGADVARIAAAWEARAEDRTTGRDPRRDRRADLGPWLLLALLPLAALAFRRGVLVWLACCIALAVPAPEAQAGWDDLRGWWHYRRGEMAAAAAAFTDPRWQAAALYRLGEHAAAERALRGFADADAHYNRGNALARGGRLVEALAAYEAALRLRPDDADARHNRDLVARLLRPPPPAAAGAGGGGGGGAPAPPAEQEAERVAGQWLGQVPDDPDALLRARLRSEQRRRQAGEVPPPW